MCNIPGIGNAKLRNIIGVFEDAKAVYDASKETLRCCTKLNAKDIESILNSKKDKNIFEDFMKLKSSNVSFIHINDARYPKRLKQLYDYPIAIYAKGNIELNDLPTVAVVGARKCSEYGRHVAYNLSYEFAQMGISVISGLAAGIDAAGHSGCIDGGGITYAVLGCGADICYPRSNIELYMNIPRKGAIISEYALGVPPKAGQFPQRNRIISGLADAIVVVEAGEKSGSLITVDQALEQNKDVYAVPGRIGDSLSRGCNNLIKMGAQVITDAKDILDNNVISDLLRKNYDKNTKKTTLNQDENIVFNKKMDGYGLASEKKLLYSCFNLYPKSLDKACQESGLDLAAANQILLELQLEGLIKEVSKNCYVRNYI